MAILAFIFLIVGLIGAVLPVIPGPALSFIGLLLLQWSGYGGFSSGFLWIWGGITVVITVIDYILPAWLTKKFGGSGAAVLGSILGLVVGLFFSPLGIILGPFLGALIGQIIHNKMNKPVPNPNENQTIPAEMENSKNASPLKAAFGAFLAFIVGTGAKLVISSMMIYYAAKTIIIVVKEFFFH